MVLLDQKEKKLENCCNHSRYMFLYVCTHVCRDTYHRYNVHMYMHTVLHIGTCAIMYILLFAHVFMHGVFVCTYIQCSHVCI